MPASKRKHVLATLREQLHVTQGQLAEWCGCSAVTIQSVETGRLDLSQGLAERISLVTGAPVGWLLKNNPDSAVPDLSRKKIRSGSDPVSPRLSQAVILKAMIRALRALDSIKDEQSLTLLNYYTERYYGELQKAFGARKETDEPEELMDYIKGRLDAFISPSDEERKRDQELKTYVVKDASPAAEKELRSLQKATVQNRESA